MPKRNKIMKKKYSEKLSTHFTCDREHYQNLLRVQKYYRLDTIQQAMKRIHNDSFDVLKNQIPTLVNTIEINKQS